MQKRWFLFVTVFFTGMSVMGIEMTASRFLAPYFGASILVWANIIGLVLIALALGYFLGGKLADRAHDSGKFFFVILLTGICTDAIPFIGKPLLSLNLQKTGEFTGSFLAVLILFVFPLLLLGMVSPWAIRLASRKIEEVGSIAGKIYAISTAGSIVGVFLPVFATIPFLGTQKTLFLFGAVLILIGVIGMVGKNRSWLGIPMLAFILIFYPDFSFQKDPSVIVRAESLYNFLRVRKFGDSAFLQVNEGRGVQSVFNPEKFLTDNYWDYAVIPPLLNPKGGKYLIVGLGAGTSSRIIRRFFPNMQISGVEIDGKIIEFAKKYFALGEQGVDIHIGDGRTFLASSQGKYDFIMVDVYSQEYVIPFHLATREFFQLVKQKLTPDGIVFMNAAISPEKATLLNSLSNTFLQVFETSASFQVPKTSNTLFFGFMNFGQKKSPPLDIPKDLDLIFENYSRGVQKIHFIPESPIFTDDKAPVELAVF